MVIRLEDVKKVLSLLYNHKEEFSKAEDSLQDWFQV
jgi:hypothetical protein